MLWDRRQKGKALDAERLAASASLGLCDCVVGRIDLQELRSLETNAIQDL
jgi:hypothetical protein